jgi:prepilin-type N-terminal cleavage/methylation domain-containing protein
MKVCIDTRRFASRKDKGFTLLELAFVLVVVAIISIPAISKFLENRDEGMLKREADNWASISAKTQGKWTNQANYNGITEGVMINNSIFPKDMVTGTTVTNIARGGVTCAAGNIGTPAFTDGAVVCTSTNYSKDYCANLVPKVEQYFRQIKVGTTDVKPLDGTLSMATLGTECAKATAAAPVSIVFTIGK